MILVSSCSCLCPIHWSQVLSREWRCSWSSADRRCSNYIWVIDNFIANLGASYIRDLTVYIETLIPRSWICSCFLLLNFIFLLNFLLVESLSIHHIHLKTTGQLLTILLLSFSTILLVYVWDILYTSIYQNIPIMGHGVPHRGNSLNHIV